MAGGGCQSVVHSAAVCGGSHGVRRLAAVEGGGTTVVVAIAEGSPSNIVERGEFPTTTPEETLAKCCEWLSCREYDALGIGFFGPVDLHKNSPTYGYVTSTPKPGWQNTDVVGPLRSVRPDVPVDFDTDVNGAACAEYASFVEEVEERGGCPPSSCAYITVGTGVGVGLVINGAPVHGMLHPEGGHTPVPQFPADVGFQGSNPNACFGGVCVENMCGSKSLALRRGLSSTSELASLPEGDELWEAAAHYLGALCANLVLLVSPERIVISGGIMQRRCLFPLLRAKTMALLNGYIQMPQVTTQEGIDSYIVPSKFGNRAGVVGTLTLASKAWERGLIAAAMGKPPGVPGKVFGAKTCTAELAGKNSSSSLASSEEPEPNPEVSP